MKKVDNLLKSITLDMNPNASQTRYSQYISTSQIKFKPKNKQNLAKQDSQEQSNLLENKIQSFLGSKEKHKQKQLQKNVFPPNTLTPLQKKNIFLRNSKAQVPYQGYSKLKFWDNQNMFQMNQSKEQQFLSNTSSVLAKSSYLFPQQLLAKNQQRKREEKQKTQSISSMKQMSPLIRNCSVLKKNWTKLQAKVNEFTNKQKQWQQQQLIGIKNKKSLNQTNSYFNSQYIQKLNKPNDPADQKLSECITFSSKYGLFYNDYDALKSIHMKYTERPKTQQIALRKRRALTKIKLGELLKSKL